MHIAASQIHAANPLILGATATVCIQLCIIMFAIAATKSILNYIIVQVAKIAAFRAG